MATIKCARCDRKVDGMERPPFGNALGKRIVENICADCWKAWVATQNQLINHYGLNTINPEHQQLLIQNMEAFLFAAGSQAEIDTSMQGKIVH